MVNSDEFLEGTLGKLIGDCKVILSTVNMLFNNTLERKGLFRRVPMEKLIVDEASQIYVGDYLVSQRKLHSCRGDFAEFLGV